MKNLAIIPARSGSKRLQDKNIKKMNGKPLIAHTILAARDSGMFDEIIVSTDSSEYARIAQEWGANVPFLRSKETATDKAPSWDVVQEVLDNFAGRNEYFESFALLQPTSPLRTGQDIADAYRLMEEKTAKAVVSVTQAEHPPAWFMPLRADLSLERFGEDLRSSKKESLSQYRLNGAVYIVETSFFAETRDIYKKGCYAYIMKREHSVDIDTMLDFRIAEVIQAEQTGKHDGE